MLRTILIPLIILATIVAGCSKQGLNPEEAIAANKELDKKFLDAFKRMDLDAMMNYWWRSPEAVMYPSDNIEGRQGWEAINALMKLVVDGTDSVISIELMEPRYTVRGEAVIGTGRLALVIKPKGSAKQVELVSRFTDIRELKEGKWVYVYSHESMNPMAGLGSQTAMP